MGRIAEALKKAEQQRREKLDDSCAPASVGEQLPTTPPEELDLLHDATRPGVPLPGVERRARVQGVSESLVAYNEPSSVISEQYRGLRTRLLSQNPNNDHRVVAITSSIPRDGKSVTALNTAFILAEIRHLRILVVDGDFRRSSLAGLFNLKSSPGLADVLRGEADYEEVIQETPEPNLFFIAAGDTKGLGAAEVLSAKSAGTVFSAFRDRFHYTLVDTPPATTVTDVGIIGRWCHGVIMVVRLNRTPEPVAQRAVQVLQVNNIPIIGTVLVGSEDPTPGYGYYRYYKYYRYYESSDKDTRR
ncbi:MAG: CpsD/CapB family tyrosine-protein kinase [Planctomycetota bacterium]|jgi:capsular exopolysaccharide synthesis family protein